MISITAVIQYIYKHTVQADYVVSDTNGFINFWLRSMATRGETHFLKVFANHTMLNQPQRTAHLVMLKISIHLGWSRSEKLHLIPQWSKTQLCRLERSNTQLHLSTVKIQLTSFQNPQILRTISSGHDVIHSLALFPVRGFIMTNGDCHILCARA